MDTKTYDAAMRHPNGPNRLNGLNRREALRLSVPLLISPVSLLLGAAGRATAAGPDTDVSLKVTASTDGWSGGVKTGTDDMGKPAIVWTSPEGSVVNLVYTLGAKTSLVAHARQLRFRYRVEGAPVSTIHFKIVAAPLASGFQAVYRLPFPQTGKWQEAVIPVQEYNLVWGATEGGGQTGDGGSNGSVQFRLAKTAGAALTLSIGEMWLEPLPKTAPVNTSPEPNSKIGVKPGDPNAPKAPALVDPKLESGLAGLAHPRLLFPASDRDALRARAKNMEKTGYGGLTNRGDRALARAVDVPERGGQWERWYACPKHGRTLRTENPHRHVCSVDGEVFSGYPYDDVIFSRIHSQYATDVRDLGLLFQITGEARYADKTREILLAYAKKYRTFPLHDVNNKAMLGGGRVLPQSASEAQWLIPVAQGCDMVWETLTPPDRDLLRTGLFYPAVQEVIQKHTTGIEGDQCWRNSAVGLTGFLFGDKALISDALDNPDRGMQAQITRGVTNDGFWYERRWDDHFYTMAALMPLAEAAQNAGVELYKSALGDRYKKMYLLPIEMAMPNRYLPAFDNSLGDTPDDNPLYDTAYARWGDARLLYPLMGRDAEGNALLSPERGVSALLTKSADRASSPPKESRNFPDAGYAVLRAGGATEPSAPAYLAVKYGPANGVYGHPDKLTFVFFAQNRIFLDDPGPAQRGSLRESNWNKTTFAHNTLLVDEANQKPATGTCLDFVTGKNGSAVLTDAGPIYEGVTFRRAVFLLDSETAVLLDVTSASDTRPHTFDWVLHPGGAWASPPAATGPSGMKKPGYLLLRNVVTRTPQGSGAATFDLLPTGRVVVATSASYPVRIMQGVGAGRFASDDGTDIGTDKDQNLGTPCLVVRHSGTGAASQSSLLLCGPQASTGTLHYAPVTDASGKPRPEAVAAVAAFGGKRVLLVSNPEGAPVRVGDQYRGSDRLAIVPL